MFKLVLDYPSAEQEAHILTMHSARVDPGRSARVARDGHLARGNRRDGPPFRRRSGGSEAGRFYQPDRSSNARVAPVSHGGVAPGGDRVDAGRADVGRVSRSRLRRARRRGRTGPARPAPSRDPLGRGGGGRPAGGRIASRPGPDRWRYPDFEPIGPGITENSRRSACPCSRWPGCFRYFPASDSFWPSWFRRG